MTALPHEEHAEAHIAAPPEAVFAYLDDHRQLSFHMSEPSWRMAWSTMRTTTDELHGTAPGSHITMDGHVLGVPLHLEEVVTRREPPHVKEWETIGEPRLLVVGDYRMSAHVSPEGDGTLLEVAIAYDHPRRRAWLGRLFGRAYARWCVRQMARDVARGVNASGAARSAAR